MGLIIISSGPGGGPETDSAAIAGIQNATGYDLNSGLDYTGAADMKSALNAIITANAGGLVRLGAGTLKILGTSNSGNPLSILAGTTLRGLGAGKTKLLLSAPASPWRFIEMLSGSALEDIDIEWDQNTPPTNGYGKMIYADSRTNLAFRRVNIRGYGEDQEIFAASHGCVELWNCDDVVAEYVDCKWSTGTDYGWEILGGARHRYIRCNFNDNAADGVKIHQNNTQGPVNDINFLQCYSNGNGAVIMRGQNPAIMRRVITATETLNPTTEAGNEKRYQVNFGSPGTVTLASGMATGTKILLSKLIGSATVTLQFSGGEIIDTDDPGTNNPNNLSFPYTWNGGYSAGQDKDYLCIYLEKLAGLDWKVSYFTNGQGWDTAGTDMTWTGCLAWGNESAGFQYKPVGLTGSPANSQPSSGANFNSCVSYAGWSPNCNGFGVVGTTTNNVTAAIVDVSFDSCIAHNNGNCGFSITGDLLRYLTLTNCTGRYNGTGLQVGQNIGFVNVDNSRFFGNGRTGAAGSSWQVIINSPQRSRFRDTYISGVDPIGQNLKTVAEISGATPRGMGMYLDRLSSGIAMVDFRLEGCWFEQVNSNITIGLYNAGSGDTLNNFVGLSNLAAFLRVPLESVRVWDDLRSYLPAAAASDDLGFLGGAFGTNSPVIRSSDAKATTITQRLRFQVRMPDDYTAGQPVFLRFLAGMNTTVANGTATIDAEAHESNGTGGIGADLVTTSAISINSLTAANRDFAVTASGLSPGDTLDVRVTIAITDSATGTAVIGQIGEIGLIYARW